jgi:DNA-binding HxlR family transcriptional regulator
MLKKLENSKEACDIHHRAIRDTMDILSGKWKLQIVGSLSLGKKHFGGLMGHIDGIGAKMLSKELQDLELNGLVKRTVYNTKPITVEYELTSYGNSLQPLVDEIVAWGMQHRRKLRDKELDTRV